MLRAQIFAEHLTKLAIVIDQQHARLARCRARIGFIERACHILGFRHGFEFPAIFRPSKRIDNSLHAAHPKLRQPRGSPWPFVRRLFITVTRGEASQCSPYEKSSPLCAWQSRCRGWQSTRPPPRPGVHRGSRPGRPPLAWASSRIHGHGLAQAQSDRCAEDPGQVDHDGEKSQFQALRTSSQTNREALASTPPTDTAAYAALIATAQKNAATRIQLESETWSNVYSSVLTQTQRDAIPGIVAAAKAQREQRMEEWKAEHPAAPGSSGE